MRACLQKALCQAADVGAGATTAGQPAAHALLTTHRALNLGIPHCLLLLLCLTQLLLVIVYPILLHAQWLVWLCAPGHACMHAEGSSHQAVEQPSLCMHVVHDANGGLHCQQEHAP